MSIQKPFFVSNDFYFDMNQLGSLLSHEIEAFLVATACVLNTSNDEGFEDGKIRVHRLFETDICAPDPSEVTGMELWEDEGDQQLQWKIRQNH